MDKCKGLGRGGLTAAWKRTGPKDAALKAAALRANLRKAERGGDFARLFHVEQPELQEWLDSQGRALL